MCESPMKTRRYDPSLAPAEALWFLTRHCYGFLATTKGGVCYLNYVGAFWLFSSNCSINLDREKT